MRSLFDGASFRLPEHARDPPAAAARSARSCVGARGGGRGEPGTSGRLDGCLRAMPVAALLARQLEEALDRGLLVGEAVGEMARVLFGAREEVLEAALGVFGQRIDV